jgi:hypothetical protein
LARQLDDGTKADGDLWQHNQWGGSVGHGGQRREGKGRSALGSPLAWWDGVDAVEVACALEPMPRHVSVGDAVTWRVRAATGQPAATLGLGHGRDIEATASQWPVAEPIQRKGDYEQ